MHGLSTGEAALRFHSGHRNNVFQAKTLPHSADKTIVTCAADGQVDFPAKSQQHLFAAALDMICTVLHK